MTMLSPEYSNKIRDPIHGFIHLSDREMHLIDLPAFQRLRRIKQLALTSYVYPGAVHTRFEHSLGVMELATKMLQYAELNTDPRLWNDLVLDGFARSGLGASQALQILRLAALLHDIGHLPFSHASDTLLGPGIRHEHVSMAIARSLEHEIDRLFFQGASAAAIALLDPDRSKLPPGLEFMRDLVSGEIDADRCDYLLRDSLYCGVDYGKFDLDRLIGSLCIVAGDGVGNGASIAAGAGAGARIGIDTGGVYAVEALVLARYHMFSQVYYHRTRRLFDHYLSEYMARTMPDTVSANPLSILDWDDYRVMERMRHDAASCSDDTGILARRIWSRGVDGGKHAVVYEASQFSSALLARRMHEEVAHLSQECPHLSPFVDVAGGRIHGLGPSSRGAYDHHRQLLARDSRLNRAFPIFEVSKVIPAIPSKFDILRVYALGPADEVDAIRDRLANIREVY